VIEYARKPARFHRTGGSRSAVVPKDFLEAARIAEDNAQWVLTNQGVLLTSAPPDAPSIETEPAFAEFLSFLEQSAAKEPGRLGNILDLTDRYAHLVEDVEVDDDLIG
jgi:hypothetical protein